jgi:hypothetical protein
MRAWHHCRAFKPMWGQAFSLPPAFSRRFSRLWRSNLEFSNRDHLDFLPPQAHSGIERCERPFQDLFLGKRQSRSPFTGES